MPLLSVVIYLLWLTPIASWRHLDDRLLLKVMKGLATDLVYKNLLFGTVFGLLL